MSKFLATSRFKWIDPREFNLNKYNRNSSKVCVFLNIQNVDIEYAKELRELHNNNNPLAPGKIEIKKEIMSNYQIKVVDFYNIPIDNVKKLVHNFFENGR